MDKDYSLLRLKLIAVTLGFSLIPLFLVGTSLYVQFDRAYSARVKETLRTVAEDRRHALDLFFDERISQLTTLAYTHTLDELVRSSVLQDLFELIQRRSKYYVDLGVIDQNGDHLAYAGPYPLLGVNYREAPWFQSVMQRGVHISDVFLGVRKVPHFVIAVLRWEGARCWVLRATINTDLFESMVRAAQVGKGGEAYLVNEKNILQTASRFHGQVLTEAPTPNLARFRGTRLLDEELPRGRMLMAATWLRNVPWMLVVLEDPREELLPILETRSLALGLMVLSICAVVGGTVFVVRLVIAQLVESDRQKAALDANLLQTSKMAALGRLAAGIAHEINNPLAVIQEKAGWIHDLLEEEDVQASENFREFAEAVGKIEQHVDRARKVTHRLLGFARRMEPVRQPVDVNRLVEETLQFLENEALHRNIRIHVERDPSAPEVVSDGAQLQQVLLNILNNAIDAVGRDGQVWVTTQFDPAAREVRVQVADSGPGIPSEILGKIFDPFFTTKKLGSGTGLGLSICHSILTNLGGRIDAANRAEGGAVFTVSVLVNDLRA